MTVEVSPLGHECVKHLVVELNLHSGRGTSLGLCVIPPGWRARALGGLVEHR
jgi:hypothetical protein